MNSNNSIDYLFEEVEKHRYQVEAEERIVERSQQDTNRKIRFYTRLAWALVWLGLLLVLVGLFMPDQSEKMSWNEFGDFLAGTLASTWSLAGLFFIYVSFLGQRFELRQNKIIQLYTRLELKENRLELAKQKEAMENQTQVSKKQAQIAERHLEEIYLQRIESKFFKQLDNLEQALERLDGFNGSTVGLFGESRIRGHIADLDKSMSKIQIHYSDQEYEQYFEEPLNVFNEWRSQILPEFDHWLREYKELIFSLGRISGIVDLTELERLVNLRIPEGCQMVMFYILCFEYDDDLIHYLLESNLLKQFKGESNELPHPSHFALLVK